MMSEESMAVLADPQISVARVLRPYADFEDRYEGQSALRPISFYEVPVAPNQPMLTRDTLAGRSGYDPDLEAYLPVPMGSRVSIWIPICIGFITRSEIVEQIYTYTFHWRVRNVERYLAGVAEGNAAHAYHEKKQLGYPDPRYPIGTPPVIPSPRYAIPSVTNSVLIEQTESGGNLQQVIHLRRERVQVMSTYLDSSDLSILPDGAAGVRQQGVTDLNTTFPLGANVSDLYLKLDFAAEGDELLIQANRFDAWDESPDPWTFATTDGPFSNIYGKNVPGPQHTPPNGVGIYLLTGTDP
jgi:hypothetical protein